MRWLPHGLRRALAGSTTGDPNYDPALDVDGAIGKPDPLVLRGARDPIIPERWAREVAELLRNGCLAVIPNGSHSVHYAAPEATAEAIVAFLGRAIERLDDHQPLHD